MRMETTEAGLFKALFEALSSCLDNINIVFKQDTICIQAPACQNQMFVVVKLYRDKMTGYVMEGDAAISVGVCLKTLTKFVHSFQPDDVVEFSLASRDASELLIERRSPAGGQLHELRVPTLSLLRDDFMDIPASRFMLGITLISKELNRAIVDIKDIAKTLTFHLLVNEDDVLELKIYGKSDDTSLGRQPVTITLWPCSQPVAARRRQGGDGEGPGPGIQEVKILNVDNANGGPGHPAPQAHSGTNNIEAFVLNDHQSESVDMGNAARLRSVLGESGFSITMAHNQWMKALKSTSLSSTCQLLIGGRNQPFATLVVHAGLLGVVYYNMTAACDPDDEEGRTRDMADGQQAWETAMVQRHGSPPVPPQTARRKDEQPRQDDPYAMLSEFVAISESEKQLLESSSSSSSSSSSKGKQKVPLQSEASARKPHPAPAPTPQPQPHPQPVRLDFDAMASANPAPPNGIRPKGGMDPKDKALLGKLEREERRGKNKRDNSAFQRKSATPAAKQRSDALGKLRHAKGMAAAASAAKRKPKVAVIAEEDEEGDGDGEDVEDLFVDADGFNSDEGREDEDGGGDDGSASE